MIQLQRQDFNGRMLTIRRDDLRAIACILGVSYETGRRPARLAGPQPHPLTSRPRPVASRAGAGSLARVAFGVYVHVPFCARRCDYCAFATWTDRDHLIDDYLDALVVELARAADDPATGGDPAGHLGLLRRWHPVAGRPGRL